MVLQIPVALNAVESQHTPGPSQSTRSMLHTEANLPIQDTLDSLLPHLKNRWPRHDNQTKQRAKKPTMIDK